MLLFYYIHTFLITTTIFLQGSHCENSRPFLKYYETLSYDRTRLLQSHQRSKRATNEEKTIVTLDLAAYKRKFALMLRRDSSAFADDFTVMSHDQPLPVDISFLYKGRLSDEDDSFCHGSIIDGYFHGSIHTKNGTFYVEYEENHNGSLDSYMYHESDIDYSLLKDVGSFDLALKKYTFLENMRWKLKEESVNRPKRSLDLSRTSCLLHLKADYYFFRSFRNLQAAIAQIAGYLMAVNTIFEQVNFNGIKYINFKVKVLNIMQEEQPDSPLNSPYIGIEKLLMLHSSSNWNHVCLSYLLTNRDYSGTLGLAWIGRTGNLGGICSKFAKMQNSTEKACLNTGVVTIQKYGQYLPPRVIHITLAHELGHSMGSPHDEDAECAKYAVSSPYGNYLMFPRAVDGNQYNNDKFSPCSVHYISSLLKTKKDQCFVESDRPTCGNQIVEAGEQCDVGMNDNDTCCYSANAGEGLQCTLKPGKQCSNSQKICCSQLCELRPKGERCRDEAECTFENSCTGESAKCPISTPKGNYTLCNYGTRICLNGKNILDLCVEAAVSLHMSDIQSQSWSSPISRECDASSCKSTKSAELSHLFNRAVIVLPAGAPCGARQGYCDKFHICRFVDADGPIARLKNSFLRVIERDPAAWMKTRWWAILLIILSIAALMAGTIFIFGRTLDSNKEISCGEVQKRRGVIHTIQWEMMISEIMEDMASVFQEEDMAGYTFHSEDGICVIFSSGNRNKRYMLKSKHFYCPF
ncbi:PREDICTED: disintegrin and metalloproteinase domain-containing protein 10-like [Nanorana parkeri]|uniref:disintegrin and metalloproteinase domain-containing protein 10-like n=1 Tax=Nanorana parkeri TaxID=125878 RepID=UPI0008545401|nr:PREDICTED: disintegrin and metalloproteinase domain-containing protein 10-like [Nanorana parkeri]